MVTQIIYAVILLPQVFNNSWTNDLIILRLYININITTGTLPSIEAGPNALPHIFTRAIMLYYVYKQYNVI
jgi:hypothetical protein